MTAIISDATRAAMALFTRLLAIDVERRLREIEAAPAVPAEGEIPLHPGDGDWLAELQHVRMARMVLKGCDQLDVGTDEEFDRAIEFLRMAPGEVWLEVAESRMLDLTGHVGHVLHFLGEGGHPGPDYLPHILRGAKAAADNEAVLDALQGALPEQIGLWRGARLPGGIARLLRVWTAQ